MAISQKKYIDITSGVGGRSAVSERELILRVFTTSDKCGYGNRVDEFESRDDVAAWFGSSSEEYKCAEKYFGFVSKSITQPKKISFFKWSSATAEGASESAYVLGRQPYSVSMPAYGACNKVLALKVDGIVHEFEVDFSPDISDSSDDSDASDIEVPTEDPDNIAVVLEAVKKALTDPSLPFYFEEVTITQTLNSTIKIDFGSAQGSIDGFIQKSTAEEGVDYDLGYLLGILNTTAVNSDYAPFEEPVDACARSNNFSDNYGSFFFLGGIPDTPDFERTTAIANWNKTLNFKYLFIDAAQGYSSSTGGLLGGVLDVADALNKAYSETTIWAYRQQSDYIETLPAALFATTDYNRTNSTKSFMYQQNNTIEAAITSEEARKALDEAFVNYMGTTQFAGGFIQFSQDGVCTDGTEIGVVCNEIWMKSKFWADIMNLFLSVEKVPANEDGVALLKTVMMDTITTAIRNGTIMPRKTLNTTQKVYIGQVTGREDAWQDVYNDGYTLDLKIEQDTKTQKYIAKYVLVYSKGDAIRKVEGSDILI